MKLQQLRYIVEVVNHDLNVSAAAESLFTSQPGVSKQIKLLEDELGVQIFVRHGKNLTSMTEVGRQIVLLAKEILAKSDTIKTLTREYTAPNKGALTIATTDMQARYELPTVIQQFVKRYPDVSLHMNQGTLKQISESLLDGTVDFAIVTERLPANDDLIMLPCYHWNRAVIVKSDHPLAERKRIRLEELAAYPLVTYHFTPNDETILSATFSRAGLVPNIAFSAMDAEVIKTYVRLGLGVGVVAKMTLNSDADRDFVVLNAGHLFSYSTTYLVFQRTRFLRNYMYDFILQFVPHLTRDVIDKTLALTTQLQIDAMFNGVKLPVK